KRIQDFSGFFNDTFLVVYGNSLIDLNIAKLMSVHRRRGAAATVVLKDVTLSEVSNYAVVTRDDDGKITHFQERPEQHEALSTTVSTDVYVFEPGVLDILPSNFAAEINEHLLPALVTANSAVYGVVAPFASLSVNTLQNYWYASRQLMLEQLKGYQLPGAEIVPGVRTGLNVHIDLSKVEIRPPVYIGNSSYIGAGCKIYGPAVIGANCIIKDGAMLQECFIDDYTRISEIATLEQTVILGDKCIDPAGHVLDIKESDIGWLISDAREQEANVSDSAEQVIHLAKEVVHD
ncbi:MAG: NDP-sugar synthase, partial [Pseudomonadota bacterium]